MSSEKTEILKGLVSELRGAASLVNELTFALRLYIQGDL
jgi:hypothetical protein